MIFTMDAHFAVNQKLENILFYYIPGQYLYGSGVLVFELKNSFAQTIEKWLLERKDEQSKKKRIMERIWVTTTITC